MVKPNSNEYPSFYAGYVNAVNLPDGLAALKVSGEDLMQTLAGIPKDKGSYQYAEGKWSVNELVQHLIDSEIIFASRALRISRGDKTSLPGFEQDDYVKQSYADYQHLDNIIELFSKTRAFTIALMNSLPLNSTENIGYIDNKSMSVRALCFIISGHTIHHTNILKQRYL